MELIASKIKFIYSHLMNEFYLLLDVIEFSSVFSMCKIITEICLEFIYHCIIVFNYTFFNNTCLDLKFIIFLTL